LRCACARHNPNPSSVANSGQKFSARLPENFGAGEKIRPHTLRSKEAGFIDVNKESEGMVIGIKSGNSDDFTVFSSMYLRFYVKTTLQESSAPFLPFFGKSADSSAADFLSR
jgi:hypothetical protein